MTESEPVQHASMVAHSATAATASATTALAPDECASRLLHSRVGRALQRYDGATRLLACVVVLRAAPGAGGVEPQHQQPARIEPRQEQDSHTASISSNTTANSSGSGSGSVEVLVISSSKHPHEWILPKGGWESDETLVECALREVEEEAGIAGHVERELGEVEFASNKGSRCRLHGFQMSARREFRTWAESGSRQRRWVSVAEAQELLRRRPELLAMLARAVSS